MKPRNKLQAQVQREYLHGQALRHEFSRISPRQLSKKYSMDIKTIRKVARGFEPAMPKRTPEVLAAITEEFELYQKLRTEWLEYTVKKIGERYGVTQSTVFNYGNGRFGMQDSPNLPDTVDPELLVSDSVERFLTMPLTRHPATHNGYY